MFTPLLPLELAGEIINCLNSKDAVSFAKTNKQMMHDACRSDFGYHVKQPVAIHVIFNAKKGYTKRPYVIGYFKSFKVQNMCELLLLCESTKKITFDNLFNQKIDYQLKRFKQLTHLTFGRQFEQPVDSLELPNTLLYLEFGHYFDQPVSKLKLPHSLTHLVFGRWFNKPVHELNSKSLTHLVFGENFEHPIFLEKNNDKFPSLTNLTVQPCLDHSVDNLDLHFCTSLKHLKFNGYIGLWFYVIVDKIKLPDSLTHLEFGHWFNQPVDKLRLPNSLTHLTFGFKFNQLVDNLTLPNSLIALTFGNHFSQPVDRFKLPNSLKYIDFGSSFNESVDNLKLPDSLIELKFGILFTQPIDNLVLPPSLKRIDFGLCFNKSVDKLKQPLLDL